MRARRAEPQCERIIMPSKDVIVTDTAPAAIGPYSQAIVVNGMVYTAGVIPLDPETKEIAGSDIRSQAERVLTSLSGLLEAAGSSLDQVVKTTCFLQDLNDFPAFNESYATFFGGDAAPARSTVQVAKLPMGVLVEIEAVAVVNG
jgi:2-iminobutanoate/2-iminopropanoate deaminase